STQTRARQEELRQEEPQATRGIIISPDLPTSTKDLSRVCKILRLRRFFWHRLRRSRSTQGGTCCPQRVGKPEKTLDMSPSHNTAAAREISVTTRSANVSAANPRRQKQKWRLWSGVCFAIVLLAVFAQPLLMLISYVA